MTTRRLPHDIPGHRCSKWRPGTHTVAEAASAMETTDALAGTDVIADTMLSARYQMRYVPASPRQDGCAVLWDSTTSSALLAWTPEEAVELYDSFADGPACAEWSLIADNGVVTTFAGDDLFAVALSLAMICRRLTDQADTGHARWAKAPPPIQDPGA